MGACFEVYKEKGCGFVEPVYQECLSLELKIQGIPFAEQVQLVLEYKGRPLKQTYRPDFVCFDKIIVEIKAVSTLTDQHSCAVAQLPESNWKKARTTCQLRTLPTSRMGANHS